MCQYLLEQAGERRSELANLVAGSKYGTNGRKTTPVMWAAWAGNLPLVELLVLHGGDPLAQDVGATNQTALHWAAGAGHLEVCQYLLSAMMCAEATRKKKIGTTTSSLSSTILQKDKEEEEEEVTVVVEGVLLHAKDAAGLTPLDYAQRNDHGKVVDWILEQFRSIALSSDVHGVPSRSEGADESVDECLPQHKQR